MEYNLALVKRHPYITAAIVLVGVLILYLLMKRSGGKSQSSSGGTITDSAFTGLESGVALQNAQINAGVQTAQLQGQVASNQINAELEAAKVQQQTALAIVGKQEDTRLAITQDVDESSLAATAINANAALQITTQNDSTVLGIANLQHDIASQTQSNLRDIALRLGTQKELGSKVIGVLAAFQGPQAIAANQPTQVAQVHADASGGFAGILKALNPASILTSVFG